ncbi:MAG: hypothetical protein E6Q40_08795 [Cupriavidus sp.]|nr:MAG: hypothetical protein E6Q40_08795 [Cupriavidus sp.]
MTTSITAFIGSDGLIKFVYDDDLQPLLQLGAVQIQRASHVEPTPLGWTADLSPSAGPVLGPFPLRRLALQAETDWLLQQMGG